MTSNPMILLILFPFLTTNASQSALTSTRKFILQRFYKEAPPTQFNDPYNMHNNMILIHYTNRNNAVSQPFQKCYIDFHKNAAIDTKRRN